jgi:hypothetical protein
MASDTFAFALSRMEGRNTPDAQLDVCTTQLRRRGNARTVPERNATQRSTARATKVKHSAMQRKSTPHSEARPRTEQLRLFFSIDSRF